MSLLCANYHPFNIFLPILLLLPLIVNCLELSRMDVPGPCLNGSSLWLQCNYHLNTLETLYSVKWYKNNLEFYRYSIIDENNNLDDNFNAHEDLSPSISNINHNNNNNNNPKEANPMKKYFPQQGIHVDINQSNGSHVYLSSIDLDGEGTYGCEVSTEDSNGSFKSVKAEKDLRIYVLPQSKLKIIGTKDTYQIGELVNISCLSGPSKPPTILALFINGHRILQSERNLNYNWTVHYLNPDGLAISWINVSFQLTSEKGLTNGQIDLRCSALQSQISGYSYEELIVDETGYSSKISESYPSPDQLSSSPGTTLNPVESWLPLIHGLHGKPRVGDYLTVNCTGPKSQPSVFIQWFINGKEPFVYNIQPAIIQSDVDQPGYQFTSTIYDYFASFTEMNPPSASLSFKITKKLFQTVDGSMRLRCLSFHSIHVHSNDILLSLFTDSGKSSRLLFNGSQSIKSNPNLLWIIITFYTINFLCHLKTLYYINFCYSKISKPLLN
ncbi:uncharacterized protein LOC128394184 [Panonychus citri]|uniref:uncharacterized protein LOC128394184 n=1 Tax=Panonychus citri TaxID=50023 RepID=UPI0023082FF9|nr:uncharacterized protein LOC128394184 [Panonychus citri]